MRCGLLTYCVPTTAQVSTHAGVKPKDLKDLRTALRDIIAKETSQSPPPATPKYSRVRPAPSPSRA
jgi:hypothetical protein